MTTPREVKTTTAPPELRTVVASPPGQRVTGRRDRAQHKPGVCCWSVAASWNMWHRLWRVASLGWLPDGTSWRKVDVVLRRMNQVFLSLGQPSIVLFFAYIEAVFAFCASIVRSRSPEHRNDRE